MRGSPGWIVLVTACVLLAIPLTMAQAQVGDDKGIEHSDHVRQYGAGFCFQRNLVFGNTVILGGGRCYNFYLLNTTGGVFLGFGPQGEPLIPFGQIVRLNTPAGIKVRGRLSYMIPLAGYVSSAPAQSIQFLQVQAGLRGNRIVILVPRTGSRPHEVSLVER
jgi:hypothetical protein